MSATLTGYAFGPHCGQGNKLDGKHASWVALNLATWWSMHAHAMRDHHNAEEKIFFPAFAERFPLPARFTESHAVLMDEMAAVQSALVKLLEGASCTRAEEGVPAKSPFGDDGPLLGWVHNGGEAQLDKMLDALNELQSVHAKSVLVLRTRAIAIKPPPPHTYSYTTHQPFSHPPPPNTHNTQFAYGFRVHAFRAGTCQT